MPSADLRAFESEPYAPGVSPKIVIAANSIWNVVNFRQALIRALKSAGYDPVVVAPADPAAEHRMSGLEVCHVPVRIDRSGLNPVGDLRLLASYRRIFRTISPVAFLG